MNKMKVLLVVAGILSLAACKSVNPTEKVKIIDNAYSGVLPCADCSGIDTTILMEKDGTYVIEYIYLETKDGNQSYFETGTWAKDGNKYLFVNTAGDRSYYDLQDKKLVMLDQEGKSIESNMNYSLAMVQPTKLSGEYRYMADAATFKDCKTGLNYAVNESIELERGYGKTGVEGGTPVYVEVEGYYSIRPSMEDGLFNPALIQTGSYSFDKSKTCK